MTPEEKRRAVKRGLVKEAMQAEADQEITRATPPQRPGAPAERETTLAEDATDAALAVSQGMTMGGADEAVAAAEALNDFTRAKLGNRGDISLSDAYRTNKNAQDRLLARSEERSPILSPVAEVGGALLSPQLGATAVQKIISAAVQSALTGAGKSKANPIDDPAGLATDMGIGTVLGAGGQAVGGKIAEKLGAKGLGEFAEDTAEKAVARSQSKAMENMPKGAGRELLTKSDSIPGSEKVVQFWSPKAADMAERATSESARVGKEIGKLLQNTDEAIGEPFVDGRMIAERIRKVIEKYDSEGSRPTMEGLEKIAARYEEIGLMSFQKAQKQKIGWKFSPSAVGDPVRGDAGARNAVRAAIAGEIEDAFDRLPAAMTTKPYLAPRFASAKSLKDEYKALNRRYAATETAEETAENLAGKQKANLSMGLRELGAGVAVGGPMAYGTGSPLTGLATTAAAMLASKLAKERGPAALAVAADKASRVMNMAPELVKRAPVMRSLVGPELGAVHMFMLESDPTYKVEVSNAETRLKAPRVKIGGLPLPMDTIGDDPFFKNTQLSQAILSAADGKGKISDPEALAQLSALISDSDEYDTVQKANLLSGIGKTGRVDIDVSPEPPAMIQRPPQDAAPPPITRERVTNALKAASGGP